MTVTYVIMQNVARNPLRAMLTALAFALPMIVFVAAISLVAAFIRVAAANEKELRLGVHHRVALTVALPEGHRRKIEALDPSRQRLSAVCGMRWFGGRVPNTPNALISLAADADTFPVVFSDVGMTPDEIAAWQRDRTAAVVGYALGERHGWKKGDRVLLESTIPPYLPLEFRVVKVVDGADRGNMFYLRRDYLVESMRAAGIDDARCHIFWVKCTSLEAMRALQPEIDHLFANSPEETKSEDENAFAANFTQSLGDIPGLMRAMAVVVVFIVALVAGNTMMMSFRERTQELAVFKAIGFSSGRVFRIVLAESILLALVGSLAGVLPAALTLYLFPLRQLRMGAMSGLELSPLAVVVSLAIALLVGLAAGAWPAYQAMRLCTVDALRHGA